MGRDRCEANEESGERGASAPCCFQQGADAPARRPWDADAHARRDDPDRVAASAAGGGAACWCAGTASSSLRDELSPISRQHIDLFQGGQLSESAVESAKARFRDLLERGEVAAVEASLRAGMQYVVQVRALAELGTDDAGRILERQLHRRLTDDQIEQAWYWIDLANGLRTLNRAQSLPHLLRCAEAAGDPPLGQFFAAETICFLGFSGYLRQFETPLGRSALRVFHRALEGLRFGVPPNVVAEARVGELIETLWDNRDGTDRSAGRARLRRSAAPAAAGAARRDDAVRRGVRAGGVRLADVAPDRAGAGPDRLPARSARPCCVSVCRMRPARSSATCCWP